MFELLRTPSSIRPAMYETVSMNPNWTKIIYLRSYTDCAYNEDNDIIGRCKIVSVHSELEAYKISEFGSFGTDFYRFYQSNIDISINKSDKVESNLT